MKFLFFVIGLSFVTSYAQNSAIEKDFHRLVQKKSRIESINSFTEKYRNLGYAELFVDTSLQPYQLHIGKIYFLNSYSNNLNFTLKNLPLKINKPFVWKNYDVLHQKILNYYGNLGYPFVNIQPNIRYQLFHDTVKVNISEVIDLQNVYTIDTIIIPTKIKENPKFIYRIIDLAPGDRFHQEKIEKIVKNLKRSEYYHNIQPPQLQFSDSSTKITLNFEKLRNNRFDLLMGLLPPQNNTQKLQFTVMADFSIISMFGQGEILKMKYDKLQNLSQKLNIQYIHPFLFQLPVKLNFQLELFKQDTSFLNRTLSLGGSYILNMETEIIAGYQQKNSNLISISRYQNITWPPPPQLDSRSTNYLLGYQMKQLDNPFNPQKGFFIYFLGSTGVRKILKVRGLENLDYERIGKIQPKQELEMKFFKYFPIGKRTVAVAGLQGYYLNQKNYFENDLKPIGGYKILRGFNENSFWASYYALVTVEYRLILEEFSYIGVFADFCYLNQKKWEENQIYKPIGTGIAINFHTSLGIMSVSYAIGKYENLSFQPTRGRIHVGIINNF